MQLLPDGKVRIQNTQTGESKDIDPIELPKYNPGLVAEYQKLKATPAPTPQPMQSDPEQMVKKSLSQSIGEGVVGFGKSLAQPFIRTGKNIIGAKQELDRAKAIEETTKGKGLDVSMGKGQGVYDKNASLLKVEKKKSVDDLIKRSSEINKQMVAEKDPVKKQQLIDESRAISAKLEGRSEQLDQITSARGVLNDSDMQKLNDDPRSAVIQQLKDSTNIASYAVPFGKGSNFVTKAAIPGAVVGGMQEASQEGATPESVVGSAALGAGAGVLLHGASTALGKLKGTGQRLEQAGSDIRASNRKITMPGSVYGAGEEEAINKTLNQKGIVGKAADQYKQLQPAMEDAERQLQEFVTANPDIKVPVTQLRTAFREKLKGALLSKDLTSSQVTQEVEGFLRDLNKQSGGTGKFTDVGLDKLVAWKRLINNEYAKIDSIMEKGGSLNSRQKVIKEAWSAIDDAITSVAPEVKQQLTTQSHLYKAAPSISRARFNPPTARFMGTSIPGAVTQTATDLAGRATQSMGRGVESVGNAVSGMGGGVGNVSGQIASRLPLASQDIPDLGQDPNQENYSPTNDVSGNQPNGQVDHGSILPDIPQTLNPYGATPEIIYREYQNALNANDTKTASRLKTMYEDEVSYQKDNKGGSKSKAASALQVEGKAKAGSDALTKIETMIKTNPLIIAQAAVPGSPGARQFEAAVSSITDAIGGLRTGASVSPQQQKFYRDLLPKLGDSQETIDYKLQALKNELNTYLQGSANLQDTLPNITQ